MSAWRPALLWLVGALAVRSATAAALTHPGYIDAYYAYHVAAQVAGGRGLSESVLWNYLSGPLALPRPSNAYWPPGTALFAVLPWLGARAIWPAPFTWRWAEVAPVAGSALLVPAGYLLARRLAPGAGAGRRAALVAWLLLFSGVYFPYWVTTDSFTPAALLGGACLWLSAALADGAGGWAAPAAGAAAGLLAAVRADGPLMVVAPLVAVACRPGRRRAPAAGVIGGALVASAPLLLRSWLTWHALAPPGAARALWLREYDDLFAYRDLPSLERFLAAGPAAALAVRANALAANLGVLGAPLLYYLVPFTVAGAWRARHARRWWPALAYLGALLATMSLLFPLPGARGGLFHSLAALLPLLLLWTALGLECAVAGAARRRRWPVEQAQRTFATAVCVLAVAISVYFWRLQTARWDQRLHAYRAVAAWLDTVAPEADRVMAVDPPGFWYASGRDSVVVPSDGFGALSAAAAQYGVSYLLLERAAPRYLVPVYDGREAAPDLYYLTTVEGVQVLRVLPGAETLALASAPGR